MQRLPKEQAQEGDEDAMTMTTSSLVNQLKHNNSIKAEDPEEVEALLDAEGYEGSIEDE